RALFRRQVVCIFLVERSHRRGFAPSRPGRRRIFTVGVAAHRQSEGGGRSRRRAGAEAMKGFTLLEVMISLAILAVGLVAISNLNGGAVAMHAYGRRATEATLLLRGKMLDVEDDLQKKGCPDFNDEQHGTFEDEQAPAYAWSAEILKPDVQLDPAQLLALLGVGGNKDSKQQSGGIA